MRIAIFVVVLGSVVTGGMFYQCFHSLRIGHVPFSRQARCPLRLLPLR